MLYAPTLENLAVDTSPVVLPDAFAGHLMSAVRAYQHTLPNGETVWPPFVLNGRPSLPAFMPLERDGAGKSTPEQFAAAADYAHDIIGGRPRYGLTVADEVRRRLVDGSLPDDEFNYTGVDCSGFVTTVLARSLGACGIDLYSKLAVSPEHIEEALYGTPGHQSKDTLAKQAVSEEGLSIRAFIRAVRDHGDPLRGVSAQRLAWNSADVVDGPAQSGDIGLYRGAGSDKFGHVAVVLGTLSGSQVHFASSTRADPRIEIGGVGTFMLPMEDAFDQDYDHGYGLSMSLRRLNFIQPADN